MKDLHWQGRIHLRLNAILWWTFWSIWDGLTLSCGLSESSTIACSAVLWFFLFHWVAWCNCFWFFSFCDFSSFSSSCVWFVSYIHQLFCFLFREGGRGVLFCAPKTVMGGGGGLFCALKTTASSWYIHWWDSPCCFSDVRKWRCVGWDVCLYSHLYIYRNEVCAWLCEVEWSCHELLEMCVGAIAQCARLCLRSCPLCQWEPLWSVASVWVDHRWIKHSNWRWEENYIRKSSPVTFSYVLSFHILSCLFACIFAVVVRIEQLNHVEIGAKGPLIHVYFFVLWWQQQNQSDEMWNNFIIMLMT